MAMDMEGMVRMFQLIAAGGAAVDPSTQPMNQMVQAIGNQKIKEKKQLTQSENTMQMLMKLLGDAGDPETDTAATVDKSGLKIKYGPGKLQGVFPAAQGAAKAQGVGGQGTTQPTQMEKSLQELDDPFLLAL